MRREQIDARERPGDDIASRAHLQATRAITIDAPPKEVWPWLVHMGGYTRAGWYSYDRIDNAGRPSADRIVPELQHLQVGDVMPTAPDGSGFTVERIDPPQVLVLSIHAYEGTVSCCLALRERRDGSRLASGCGCVPGPRCAGWPSWRSWRWATS
ncbi:hypothetical protein ACIHFD_66965 [Nonomuraea sp. NPDC051941]|uniref:hypothetical protein n=1 Tax=Nonomuraea sp. NPDC051941 TaxID=3364373 RepID=UPI0037C564B4